MPRRPLHGCALPGCPQLTDARYCAGHAHLEMEQRRHADAQRPQSQDRGYDTKWRAYRKEYLAANPFCVDPYHRHVGEQRRATQVDHIIAHKGNQRLFWSPRNHQSLCASCGGYKSAVEPGGRAEPGRQLAEATR